MKNIFKLMAIVLVLFGLVACQDKSSTSSETADAEQSASNGQAFRILAGSELKDVADKVTAYGRSQGIDIQFDYTGSLDAVDKLMESHAYDAVWISHGKYLQLVPQVKAQIKASEKTMYSRVVLGVKPEKMKALGWASGKTSWRDIISAVKAGKFHFAMTSPTGSNTGFVALVGLATELSGKGDALTADDIPAGELKALFAGQAMSSGSSGLLAEQFLQNPLAVDGMVNYESVIRMVSQKVPLEVLIPKEGVITADYPLMLLKNSAQQGVYDKLIAFLRSPQTQEQIAQETARTPLSGAASTEVVNELPFPGSLKVVDAILRGFVDDFAKPSSSVFVLDVSGSMEGERLAEMQNALIALAQGDGTVSGRFATFRSREQITLAPFSNQVQPKRQFELSDDAKANAATLAQVSSVARMLRADGGTAIYDALFSVYDAAQAELKKGERNVSIVLFTDGESNQGESLEAFLAHVNATSYPRVPVHAILYGESDVEEMKQLTTATGGRVFDARKASLKSVLKSIRSFQ